MSDLELDGPHTEWREVTTSEYHKEPVYTAARSNETMESIAGVRVGVLVAITDNGVTPLVTFPGQRGTAAVAARATIDLHGAHMGRDVVLMFEDGNPGRPIILGCMPRKTGSVSFETPGHVEVDSDGQRMLVTAKDELVLRCGKASVTLTKAGKILIQGTYLSTRSSGVIRMRGGSVQLN